MSLTMAMSTLSVITTVLVLYLHHTTWTHPVPRWVQTLAFDVLARALCMRLSLRGARPPPCAANSDRCDLKSVEFVNMTSPEREVGDDVGKMVPCDRAVDCFRCTQLCVRIDEILAQLRKVMTMVALVSYYTNKNLSYRKETVRLLHNIEIRVLH